MFKILVISAPIYMDLFNSKFKDRSFSSVDIVTIDDVKFSFEYFLNYHAVVFQIEYPLFPETLHKIKKVREFFQGVFIVVDYYDYFKHRFFTTTIKAEMYYPLVNGFSDLCRLTRYNLMSKFTIQVGELIYKDIEMNLAERSCKRLGKTIVLRNREFELLRFLLENPHHVFTVSQLLEAVWDMNAIANTNTVQSHISFLRKKIDLGFPEKRLHTVNSIGYKLE
jgi:DNA-binding winged helix-turn-helix (wHTH) protein